MNLRRQAAVDAQAILEDVERGFGWDIIVTDPTGASAPIKGLWTDVHELIDPETGLAVSARRASVVLPIASLRAAGLQLPVHVADESKKPFLITFEDLAGGEQTFKVVETRPDAAMGLVVCLLEVYVR